MRSTTTTKFLPSANDVMCSGRKSEKVAWETPCAGKSSTLLLRPYLLMNLFSPI